MPYKIKKYFDDDYVMNHHNRTAEDFITSGDVAAKATLTFTAQPSVGSQLTLIAASGLTKTYVIASSIDLDNNQFILGANLEGTLGNLKTAIEHANGHAGAITVSGPASGVLILTQSQPGRAGNTAITGPMSGCSISTMKETNLAGFAGGAKGSPLF